MRGRLFAVVGLLSVLTVVSSGIAFGANLKEKVNYKGINAQLTRIEPKVKPKTKLTPAAELAPIETCKIQHGASSIQNFSSAFPIKSERMVLKEKTKVAVLAVDFKNLRAKTSPKKDLADVFYALNAFYSSMATKKISFDFVVPDKYFELPMTVEEYSLGGNFFAGGFTQDKIEKYWSYVRAAIAVADPAVDFTGVQTIIVAGPPGVTNDQIGIFVAQAATASQGFTTNEGTIYNVLIRGNDQNRNLQNWAHEMGHMLGLNDLRNTENVGAQKADGVGAFDLMGQYEKTELLVWQRFLLGILNDDQIRCVTSGAPTFHWIRPVAEKTNGVKGVVIPLGQYEGLIIESRRSLGYDYGLQSYSSGALVYALDSTIPYRRSPLKIVYPERSIDRENEYDSALHKNESVTYKGWKVTIVETGIFGDVVKVEKTN
jgi:M6 family metalloprotease-like protein